MENREVRVLQVSGITVSNWCKTFREISKFREYDRSLKHELELIYRSSCLLPLMWWHSCLPHINVIRARKHRSRMLTACLPITHMVTATRCSRVGTHPLLRCTSHLDIATPWTYTSPNIPTPPPRRDLLAEIPLLPSRKDIGPGIPITLLWTEWLTDACENITFLQSSKFQ